jgi:bifunctional DNA-binding transcriptional regulator/antitoxin component of YhaV-PrlF toxin-antitoxin module
MSRQTYTGPVQWVVVDDCLPYTETTLNQDIVRPVPVWTAGTGHTLSRNLREGLGIARNDAVIVIEDDDWYSPEYVQTVVDRLESQPVMTLCGECPSRYYNVRTRCYHELHNRRHASLCQTAFRLEMVPVVLGLLRGDGPWIDIKLWGALDGVLHEGGLCVGIKGMPGRDGIGMGHQGGGTHDPELEVLREWIGADDAWEYARWARA